MQTERAPMEHKDSVNMFGVARLAEPRSLDFYVIFYNVFYYHSL